MIELPPGVNPSDIYPVTDAIKPITQQALQRVKQYIDTILADMESLD